MVKVMKVAVQFDSGFPIGNPECLEFTQLCLRWADRLQNILGGGVSCAFSRDTLWEFLRAEYRWSGKEFAKIIQKKNRWAHYLTTDQLTSMSLGKPYLIKDVWAEVFIPKLNYLIDKEINRLNAAKNSIAQEELRDASHSFWKVDKGKFITEWL